MSTLHTIIQKSLLSLFALCFMFVALYVPQTWNKPHAVQAQDATLWEQFVQDVSLVATAGYTKITSVATIAIEWFQSNLWAKEYVLDGFAWFAIKLIIAQITRSIVNWINSGFQGMPAFVQDLNGFLLGVGTQIAGVYLQQLGMPALTAFICAPFRLNIQIAFATNYRRSMSIYPYMTNSCNISSGILGGFVGGSFNGSTPGSGWGNWINVTTQSNTYTPYGSLMAAEHEASLQMRTAISVQNKYLQFGNGFFSNKICEAVANPGFTHEKCMVSTPGNVISEALNFQLSTGVRSMIAADEINEIIGALMGQVAQTALMGVNGLLGMSSNTGYTDTAFAGSFIDEQVTEQETEGAPLIANYLTILDKQLAVENNYISLIDSAVPLLTLLNTNESIAERDRALLEKERAQANIDALTKIRLDLLAGEPADKLIAEYAKLNLHTDSQVKADEDKWLGLFTTEYANSVSLVDAAQSAIITYLGLLKDNGTSEADEQVDLIEDVYTPALAAQKAELDKIAIEWNDPSVPKVNTLQHYINLRDGKIPGVEALFTAQQLADVLKIWEQITGV